MVSLAISWRSDQYTYCLQKFTDCYDGVWQYDARGDLPFFKFFCRIDMYQWITGY